MYMDIGGVIINKTELTKIVNSVNKVVRALDFSKDLEDCKRDICDLEDTLRALLPVSKIELDIDYVNNKVGGLELLILVDEYYNSKTLNKDLKLKRPNFSSLDKLYKGIELLICVNDGEYSICASVCIDYKIKNGYDEKYDIVPIIERGYISLVA